MFQKSAVFFVVAVCTQALKIFSIKSFLPSRFGLNRVDVVDLERHDPAIVQALAGFPSADCTGISGRLHDFSRKCFPFSRVIKRFKLWITLRIISTVLLTSLCPHSGALLSFPFSLTVRASGHAKGNKLPASCAFFHQHCRRSFHLLKNVPDPATER